MIKINQDIWQWCSLFKLLDRGGFSKPRTEEFTFRPMLAQWSDTLHLEILKVYRVKIFEMAVHTYHFLGLVNLLQDMDSIYQMLLYKQ